MQEIEMEKVVINCGAVGEELEKSARLLKIISGMTALKTKSRKRIPAFDVRPGLETGCKVTLRKKKTEEVLKRLLEAINNQISEEQISGDGFSFGIPEYIEIPGMEYHRDIGIMGLDVTVVFKRYGRRVGLKKIKRGKVSKRQIISQQEIIKFMEDNFQTQFK